MPTACERISTSSGPKDGFSRSVTTASPGPLRSSAFMQYLDSRFHAAKCQPALPVALQEEKADYQRDDGYQRPGYDEGVQKLGAAVRTRLSIPRCQPQCEWIVCGVAQNKQG